LSYRGRRRHYTARSRAGRSRRSDPVEPEAPRQSAVRLAGVVRL